jgi:hypothetical protein
MGLFDPKTEHIGTDELYADWMQGDVKNLAQNIPNLQTPQYYQGQLIADMSPATQQALAQMTGFGAGAGGDLMNMQMQGGQMGLDAMGSGLGYMDQLMNQGPNTYQYDQGLYDQTMANQMGGYQGMFDHGAQQAQQNFDWNQLPGLNMQNAMLGGEGNTKFGQRGALGQAMANQNIAGFGADLWGQANQMANQNAFGAGSQNLAAANQLQGQLLSNYGNYAQLGAGMSNNAYDMGKSNIGMQMAGGNFQDAYNQSLIDADMNKWNFEQQAPWVDQQQRQALTQSWVNPGAIQYGNSPFQNLLAVGQTALGLASGGADSGWWGGGGGSNASTTPLVGPQDFNDYL